MIWLMFAGGLGGGLFLGFTLGVYACRRLVEVERAKALDMATLLIDARELVEQRPPPTPSISYASNQQWDFVVICGGTDGH